MCLNLLHQFITSYYRKHDIKQTEVIIYKIRKNIRNDTVYSVSKLKLYEDEILMFKDSL